MGNIEIRNRLWNSITANDPETLHKIMQKYPQYLNEPISDDKKTNAVTRAAYLDRPHIIAELIALGADLNCTGSAKISALMWAAAKNNIESVKLLINFGANLNQLGPFDLLAIDFAVLYGSYNTAYYLYNIGSLPTKSPESLLEVKDSLKTPWIDYPGFLMSLDKNIPPDVVPFFTVPPVYREPVFEDPVRDPNETWGNWANRMLEFERPPLVERKSLAIDKNNMKSENEIKVVPTIVGQIDMTLEHIEEKKIEEFFNLHQK